MGAFNPVIQIPVAERDASDQAAIRQVYSLYEDVHETMNTERSRQQRIGLSEYGSDCRRCVARKLSEQYVKINDPSWKAQVGTFIHAGLEEHFLGKYVSQQAEGMIPTDEHPVLFAERRVEVMNYRDAHGRSYALNGSCDLYIQGATFGLVDDWKTQGTEKLRTKTAKGQISRAYKVQMHSYAFGYELLGFRPTHVVLYALPRDAELWEAKPILMRYDRQIVIDELADIQNMIDAAAIVGWEKIIAVKPRAGYCPDCDAYERQEEASTFAWMQ